MRLRSTISCAASLLLASCDEPVASGPEVIQGASAVPESALPRPTSPPTPPAPLQPPFLPTSVPPGEDGTPTPRDPAPFPGERFTWMHNALAGWRHWNSPTSEYRFPEQMNGGCVLFDADQDGDLDVFLVTGGTWADLAPGAPFPGHALFRNDGGLRFTDVARAAGVFGDVDSYCMGGAAADVDGDGDQDLFVTGLERCWLYRNDGVRDGVPRFSDQTDALGLRAAGRWATSAAFLDADGDGRLDLYVATYVHFTVELNRKLQCGLASTGVHDYCGPQDFAGVPDWYFRQEADGRFRECALEAGLVAQGPAMTHDKGLGVIASDVDDDGDPDLYVANDLCPNLLFLNDGKGRFSELGFVRGCALSEDGRSQAGMGVDAADFDDDGDLDLWVTNLDLESNALYRNNGAGWFVDDVRKAGLAAPDQGHVGFGTDFFDADDDGDLDLAVANGHPLARIHRTKGTLYYEQVDQLFENDGAGRFRLLPPEEAGAYFGVRDVSRGLATGDLDGDGDLDLVIVPHEEPAVLLRNNHAERRATPGAPPDAVLLSLVGTSGNRDAIGAKVTLTTDGARHVEEVRGGASYLSRGDLRLHFGLGAARSARLRVRWPGGRVEELGPIEAGFEYRVREGSAIEKVRALAVR